MNEKIIHYCWFGNKEKPKSVLKMIDSWKKFCPDYKIIEWNENNFDVNCCDYVKEAYECKKYAFVSDYARIYALNKIGGIYIDTDVELRKNLDNFLKYDFCMSFQDDEYLNTGLIISKKNNLILNEILNYYKKHHFIIDNNMDMTSNPFIITNILKKHGLIVENKRQLINNILILPSEFFCPMNYQTRILKITKNTYAIHWFSATWLDDKTKIKSKITMIIKRIIGITKFNKIKSIVKKN